MISVKIVSDIVGPFCCIGLRNPERANQIAKAPFQLSWEPFLLGRNLRAEDEPILEHIGNNYGERVASAY